MQWQSIHGRWKLAGWEPLPFRYWALLTVGEETQHMRIYSVWAGGGDSWYAKAGLSIP
jgi:hypothetical protein